MGWSRHLFSVGALLVGTLSLSQGDGLLSFPIGRGRDDEFAPYYFVNLAVGIKADGSGSANQPYASCVLDTGSSNLAVASQALQSTISDSIPYTSMAYDTANPDGSRIGTQTFGVNYVKGSWSADVYRGYVGVRPGSFNSPVPSDTMPTCAGGLLCADVEFGVIVKQADFFKPCPYTCNNQSDNSVVSNCQTCFSCIVGLAYSNIAYGGITPFFNALVSEPGSTIRNVFALEMCVDDSATDAEQTSRLHLWSDTGAATPDFSSLTRNNVALMYTPIVAENYYSVQVTSMWVAGVEMELSCAVLNSPGPSIIDSGTSSLMLPTPVLQAFAAKIAPILKSVLPKGGTDAENAETVEKVVFAGGCYAFSDEIRAALPNISFGFQSATAADKEFLVTVPSDHYLVSCCIDAVNNPSCDQTWRFMVQESSCAVETSATLGLPLLTEFVVVFDRAESRIGFGVAAGCTSRVGTATQVSLGPLRQRVTPEESCASTTTASCPKAAAKSGLGTVEIILVIVCSVAVVVILLLLIDTLKSKRKLERMDKPRSYRQLNPAMDANLLDSR